MNSGLTIEELIERDNEILRKRFQPDERYWRGMIDKFLERIG